MTDYDISECERHGSYVTALGKCPYCDEFLFPSVTTPSYPYTGQDYLESVKAKKRVPKADMPKQREPSPLEKDFMREWALTALPMPIAEYRFHPVRRWRFDFVWLEKKLAIELDGKPYGGRHTRGGGFIADLEKLNAAIELGYFVLRYTKVTEDAIAQIIRVYEALP